MKTHADQINEIITKYRKKLEPYKNDCGLLLELIDDLLMELDECVNAEA